MNPTARLYHGSDVEFDFLYLDRLLLQSVIQDHPLDLFPNILIPLFLHPMNARFNMYIICSSFDLCSPQRACFLFFFNYFMYFCCNDCVYPHIV